MTRDDWDYLPVRKPIIEKIKKMVDENPNLAERGITNPSRLLEFIIIKYFDQIEDIESGLD